MTTQVQFNAFSFKSSQVRVITDPNQEFWFCGADVCDILGYKNAPDALSKHCKQGGIAKRYTPTQSGDQEMIFINEPNLYRLIIKSRKPEAEPFEAWVFEEVLPQIRKTGKYQLEAKQLALPEPEKKFTFEFTEHELQLLPWIYAKKAVILARITKPLTNTEIDKSKPKDKDYTLSDGFPFNPNQQEPRDTAGYRQLANSKEHQESDRYWVFPQVYLEDVIKGFNEKQANEILLGAGMLIQGKDKGRKYLNRLPRTMSGGKTIRCYVLEILNEDEEGEEME